MLKDLLELIGIVMACASMPNPPVKSADVGDVVEYACVVASTNGAVATHWTASTNSVIKRHKEGLTGPPIEDVVKGLIVYTRAQAEIYKPYDRSPAAVEARIDLFKLKKIFGPSWDTAVELSLTE